MISRRRAAEIKEILSAFREALEYIDQLEARVEKQNALLAVMGVCVAEEEEETE